MKVADFIINYLADYGVKEMFVVYGAANGDLIDAFVRTDKTRYVAVMHEQAGGFAAEAYAKISGLIGVAIATSGPGGGNFVTPIQNCFYDSVPCFFITGQVKTKYQRPSKELRQRGFQEADIVRTVEPITKYAKMVVDPNDIKYELEKAIFLAKEGRPGPVFLDLPIDVQKADVDPASLKGFDGKQEKFNLDVADKKIDEFLADLKKAERPIMLIGGGVRIGNAVEEMLELARIFKIPCFPTWNALDVITSDFEYYGGRVGTYGGPGRNFGVQNSDLVLAVGSRISGRLFGNRGKDFLRGAKKYLVDIDEPLTRKELQEVPFDVSIHCAAKPFLELLIKKASQEKMPDFSSWMARVKEWREKYDPVLPEYYEEKGIANPYVFFRILSEEMKEGDILVGDCGGNIVISNHAFKTKQKQRNITNNGNSPMGFSFAATMGAWFASDKKHNVVCTIGDGGFNMNIQELQTYKNYDIKAKTFIVNNHVYGITKQFQETNFQGRMEACGPVGYNPPDFVKIIEAYGIKVFTIKNNAEIRETIKQVLAYDGPCVCDVDCHEWHTYRPAVHDGRPIEDLHPFLPREEFKANMIIPPVEGWDKGETKKTEAIE